MCASLYRMTRTHTNSDASLAVQGRNKTFLAWCEGMLAERASQISSSCGRMHLEPFAQVPSSPCTHFTAPAILSDPQAELTMDAGSPAEQDDVHDCMCHFAGPLCSGCRPKPVHTIPAAAPAAADGRSSAAVQLVAPQIPQLHESS